MNLKSILIVMACLIYFGCKNNQTSEFPKASHEHQVAKSSSKLKNVPTKEESLSKEEEKSLFKKSHQSDNYTLYIATSDEAPKQVHIYSKGLDYEYDEIAQINGQVLDSYMTDIDDDDVKEFFLIIKESDNIDLKGLASNNGRSISDIYIKPLTQKPDVNSNSWQIGDNKINRTFRIDGVEQNYQYTLRKGEAGYILEGIQI